MKKIIILNGSPRKNGNTAGLIQAFTEGAESVGNQVTRFDLQQMDIHPCLGCFGGGKDPSSPCVQKDGMESIYQAYQEADVVVLASPVYYWMISGQLKCAVDRLFAVAEAHAEYKNPQKESALLMAAESEEFEEVKMYYDRLMMHLGWENRGKVLAGGVLNLGDLAGHPALEEAKGLGIQLGTGEAVEEREGDR